MSFGIEGKLWHSDAATTTQFVLVDCREIPSPIIFKT